MLRPGAFFTCLFLVVAGCSTVPRPGENPLAPGWDAATGTPPAYLEVEHVSEGPRLAPPPAPGPVSSPPRASSYADTWISLNRWSRQHGYGPLRRLTSAPLPTFALSTPRGVLVVRTGNLEADWRGVGLFLGFKPQLINRQPFVHVLDLEKNIEPLLQGFAPPGPGRRVVVIDPGHGGENTGARSVLDGTCEKEFTLDWARRIAPLLTAEGWQVYLTRTNDVDISLSNRVAFAVSHHADLFISLHFNSAAPSQEQTGLETYCLTPAGMPSTLTRGYPDNTSLVFTNNAFDSENLELGFHLQRALLPVVGKDRGVRRARFLGVLRGQNCPAVLVEGGFLSNPAEARRIAEPAYRQQLAEALATALAPAPVAGSGPDSGPAPRTSTADGMPALRSPKFAPKSTAFP